MKVLPRFLSLGLAFAAAFSAWADAPAGYYTSLNGKKEGELKTAIYNIVSKFTRISSYTDLPRYFQTTDVYPDSRRWWDMYSDIPLYAPSFSGLNREHSFPKSWWGGSTTVGAYVDLNHLYPSEMKANTAKSNYPLGEVNRNSNVRFDNGICAVGDPVAGQGGGAALVFEPDDQYKGDFARTYFYMATCYQDLTWKYTYMVNQNLYPTLNGWSVNLLMKWHRDDPVSQKERDRNDAVYGFQNNRNPFIDMPELAEYLWGSKVGETFSPGEVVIPPQGDPELLAPSRDMELQFGQVALGSTATTLLFIHGLNLNGKVDVTLYADRKLGQTKEDAAMFSAPLESIDASAVCSDDGTWLRVNYKPTAVGTHETSLALSYAGGSRPVILRGECLPVPTLTACTATDPSDIESDRYTANWTAPENETIDYFVVTRTRYVNGNQTAEELLAEDTSLEILNFDESDKESYSVQSVRLGHRSPMSNVVFVDHSGITGVKTEEPLIVQTFSGFIRIVCSDIQTNLRIFDTAGRLVRVIDTVDNNTDIDMPYGVFFIVTDQHTTPVKVAVR